MKGRTLILTFVATLGLAACSKPTAHSREPTDDPNWLLGYQAGLDAGRNDKGAYAEGVRDGIDKGRDQVCDEIRRYKLAVAVDLDKHTEICGWPDMDNSETSR